VLLEIPHRPLAELAGELVVVVRDRGATPQREVVGGDGVDRGAQARPEDELA
jgi:hypothetical protein